MIKWTFLIRNLVKFGYVFRMHFLVKHLNKLQFLSRKININIYLHSLFRSVDGRWTWNVFTINILVNVYELEEVLWKSMRQIFFQWALFDLSTLLVRYHLWLLYGSRVEKSFNVCTYWAESFMQVETVFVQLELIESTEKNFDSTFPICNWWKKCSSVNIWQCTVLP